MKLEGKKALVTGAGGGIGAAIVRALQREGAMVAGNDIDPSKVVADAVIPGDLTDPDFCNRLPELVVSELGGLDIIANNAGLMRRGKITSATDEDFNLSMAVNVEAPFRICRAAIPIMAAAGGGAIVNTASVWGVYPGADHVVYTVSKAAVGMLTQCLGKDHARDGIRVNGVCPNEVDTPMLRTGFELRGINPDTALDDLGESVPIGRVAKPEDIADVVVFLASDDARYMCGALVEVSGGKGVA